MRKISRYSGQLQWTQPGIFQREYELRSGSELMATLRIHGMCGTLAAAECSDGSWTFKRLGWCGGRATIRALGQSTNLATFRRMGWSGSGELVFADGRTFHLAPNFWMTQFAISTANDEPLARIRTTGFLRTSGEVEIVADGPPELPLLTVFGWYLFVLQQADGASVIAATA